jgi:hypothetical protein
MFKLTDILKRSSTGSAVDLIATLRKQQIKDAIGGGR